MNARKQRKAACLLTLSLLVGCSCLLVWRERRQERLSAQLLAVVKEGLLHSHRDSGGQAQGDSFPSSEVEVTRLLQAGADPNARDDPENNRTLREEIWYLLRRMFTHPVSGQSLPPSALNIAVHAGDASIVTVLLQAGADDINAEILSPVARYPAVNYAAQFGDLEVVWALCIRRADLNRTDSEGESALLVSLEALDNEAVAYDRATAADVDRERKRRSEIFHLLLAQGAHFQAGSQGQALLCAAAEGGFFDVARELLAAGVSPDAAWHKPDGTQALSPLAAAVKNEDLPLVKLLLQQGATTKDPSRESPLVFAHRPEMAALLLAHGADRRAVVLEGKRGGENVLALACHNNEMQMVKFWIAHGIEINSGHAAYYDSPIVEAARYGDVSMVRLLLEHGAKVGPQSPGAHARWLAIAESASESAGLILHHGAAVNSKENSPLVEAALQDDYDIAQELLERGADATAEHGMALLYACEACDEDLVALLLKHGVNPNARTDEGMTPAQLAKENADPPEDADRIIALLKRYGAKRKGGKQVR